MSPIWIRRLSVILVLFVAARGAARMAEGDFLLIGVAGAVALAFVAHRLFAAPFDAVLVGFVVVGYIVGNRGFAQQSPTPGLPLLPAEIALAVAGAWLVVKSAIERRLPFGRSALELAILCWLLAGCARMVFDLPRHRFLAVRDFATVYYVGFFFVALAHTRTPSAAAFLRRCLAVAFAVLPFVYALHELFPAFFLSELTIRGVPLVYFKGDVAVPMIAAGVFFFHFGGSASSSRLRWLMAAGMLLLVAVSNSRAALVAIVVVDLLLLVLRRPRVPFFHLAGVAVAALALAALAASGHSPWAERHLHTAVERIASIADLRGEFNYESETVGDKPDNNRFRLMWWRSVALQVAAEGPAFGLGFGADLSSQFVRNYDLHLGEDFTARSPHSILFSALGRMGAVGLLTFGLVVVFAARAAQRSFRSREEDLAGLWCALGCILVSACFGVVLEGPMGAVPFWTMLGLVYGEHLRRDEAWRNATAQLPVAPKYD